MHSACCTRDRQALPQFADADCDQAIGARTIRSLRDLGSAGHTQVRRSCRTTRSSSTATRCICCRRYSLRNSTQSSCLPLQPVIRPQLCLPPPPSPLRLLLLHLDCGLCRCHLCRCRLWLCRRRRAASERRRLLDCRRAPALVAEGVDLARRPESASSASACAPAAVRALQAARTQPPESDPFAFSSALPSASSDGDGRTKVRASRCSPAVSSRKPCVRGCAGRARLGFDGRAPDCLARMRTHPSARARRRPPRARPSSPTGS